MANLPAITAAHFTIDKKMRNMDNDAICIGKIYDNGVILGQYWNKKRNMIYVNELELGGGYYDIITRFFYRITTPCAVGDTVYYRTYENNGSTDIGIQPHEVIGIKTIVQTKGADISIEAFGKNVFMSKEEAGRVE